MTDKRNQPPTDGAPVTRPDKPASPVQRDHWFDNQLGQLFNQVASEPLPPELANLVLQLKAGDRSN